MFYLIIVTLVWAFSFSFIGIYLSGQVDTWFAVMARILIACCTFLPFLRFKGTTLPQKILLMLIGSLQLGIMYIFYYNAFNYISIPEVLLFTIFTPIYINLFYDLSKNQLLRVSYLLTAILAIIGAGIIRYDNISSNFMVGLLLIQGANISFALGQIGYKRIIELYQLQQHKAFAWVYIGAAIVALLGWFIFGDSSRLPTTNIQWAVIVWLGVIASGLCYFLWDYGATKVDSGILAIMNNAVIPAGIMANVILWQQSIDWARFLVGSSIIVLSLLIHQKWHHR